jgi:hypothetical protein
VSQALYTNFQDLAMRIAAKNPQDVRLDQDGEVMWEGFRE